MKSSSYLHDDLKEKFIEARVEGNWTEALRLFEQLHKIVNEAIQAAEEMNEQEIEELNGSFHA